MATISITGASSGIGNAAARLFAEKGWQVSATMRRPERETGLAGLDRVRLMPLDVTSPSQIAEICQKALASAEMDVLPNNAGYGLMAPLEKLAEADIRRLFDTDVIGSILVTQQSIPHFKQLKRGTIMVTISLTAAPALVRRPILCPCIFMT